MILVAAALAVFFIFQPQVSLYAIFDQQGTDRLRTAGLLIAHDLGQMPKAQWADILARHAAIHRVDFTIVLEDGSHFSSTDGELPEPVMTKVRDALRRRPPKGPFPPPQELGDPQRMPQHSLTEARRTIRPLEESRPCHPRGYDGKPHFMMRTRRPARYWSGLRIPLPPARPWCCYFVGCIGFPDRQRIFFRSVSLDGRGRGGDIDFSVVLDSHGQKHHQATCPHDPCNGRHCQRPL